jgi:hypothetical protein
LNSLFTLTAFGKPIITAYNYYNGKEGGEWYSFSLTESEYTGKQLEDVRLEADFYGLLDWKDNYKTAAVKGTEEVAAKKLTSWSLKRKKAIKPPFIFQPKLFCP